MLSKQTNIIIICTNKLIYDHLRGERLKTVEIKIKTNVIYSIVSMGESLYGKLNKMEKGFIWLTISGYSLLLQGSQGLNSHP